MSDLIPLSMVWFVTQEKWRLTVAHLPPSSGHAAHTRAKPDMIRASWLQTFIRRVLIRNKELVDGLDG